MFFSEGYIIHIACRKGDIQIFLRNCPFIHKLTPRHCKLQTIKFGKYLYNFFNTPILTL